MKDDLISRSALLEEIKRIGGHPWSEWETAGVVSMANAIPAVDAVEVVFCDNCTSHNNCVAEGAYRLARIEKPFCCAGKRRDDNAD